jgi:hypothetical protein
MKPAPATHHFLERKHEMGGVNGATDANPHADWPEESHGKEYAEFVGYAVACGAAVVEGGLNPIADIGCIADAAAMLWPKDDKVPDPGAPHIDLPVSPDNPGPYTQTAHEDPPPPLDPTRKI